MKIIEDQIARDISKLMRGEFDFNPKKILNKTLIFDNKKNHEEIIMDMIIDVHNDKMMKIILSNLLVQTILLLMRRWKIRN